MREATVTLAQLPPAGRAESVTAVLEEHEGADLVVFPEATLEGEDLSAVAALRAYVEARGGPAVVIGVVHHTKRGSFNYAYLLAPGSTSRYQKVHVHWTERYVPGDRFVTGAAPLGRVGLLICYDTAFQETGRVLALAGAELIVAIAAVPEHFHHRYLHTRHAAMALNNQVFVASCCRPGPGFSGHSAVFDPRGQLALECGRRPQVRTVTVDLEEIRLWRDEERIYPHRRPDLYGSISRRRGR